MKRAGVFHIKTLALLLFAAASQVDAGSLQSIDFRALGQDSFQVELRLSDADPVDSQVYVIEEPARIVLDMPSVTNEVSQREFPLNFANASEAVLLGTDERTRLVLNLELAAQYETEQVGNRLILTVGSGNNQMAQAAPSSANAAPSTSMPVGNVPASSQPRQSSPQIVDFGFNRGEEGEGNIHFEFSGDQIDSDVEQSGTNIVLRFFGTDLPADLERIFNVVDFATPVRDIRVERDSNEVRVEISTLDLFDYLAYQADNTYVLSVKPLTPQQQQERLRQFAFTGESLSLNFQDIEVRAVLQLIADFTGLNLVASDTVAGNITLRLENVPWDQALDIVLKAKGLDKRQEGNVLLVAPIAEIAERERLQVQANRQLEELAPLRTEFIRIRYADAQNLYNLLSGTSAADVTAEGVSPSSILSERGAAIVDSRTNTIILTDTDEKIADFLSMVEQIDVPIRQVMIEARIVIANTDFREELGVRWGGAGVRTLQNNDYALQFGGSRDVFADGGPLGFFNGNNDLDLADTLAVDLGVASPAASFGIAFLSDSAFVDLELSALENEGHGEIVSQPKVITGDKQTAMIRSGQEVAFQEAAASGATTTSFKEAVLALEVTPQITPDDRVILDLIISQDSIGDLVFGGEPTIDVTELQTQVLVDSGDTLVLGGIFQMNSIDQETRVPILGSLPILGRAFRQDVTSQEKREILIFITPKILNDAIQTR